VTRPDAPLATQAAFRRAAPAAFRPAAPAAFRPAATLVLAALLALGAQRAGAEATAPGIAPGTKGAPTEQQLRGPVALVADVVRFDNATRILTAEGNVEVYQGQRTLTADRIEYNSETGRISASGDVTLRSPEGVAMIADMAELDTDLREALVQSARMQLPGGARFAATTAQRIDGRYNVLGRAVFSPCSVCAADPVPLWRIRARRIVHDELDKVVHYEDATFDILGVPVVWLPYFRHADPSVARASGFLFPEYLQSSTFGHAVKTPVHWVIDDASDATFTPFVTSDDGPIFEGEYRRTFDTGAMTLAGSVSWNDYDGDERLRGHIDSAGLWTLGKIGGLDGWKGGFDIEIASDDSYLRRYEFTEADRLTSEAFLRQSDRSGFLEFSTIRFQSLRDDEPFGNIPVVLPSFEGRRRVDDNLFGGILSADTAGYGLVRAGGQDTAHLGFGLDWERSWTLPVGLVLRAVGEAQADAWRVNDGGGSDDDDSVFRFHPQAAIEARYPMFRRDDDGVLAGAMGGGVTHVIEPIVQVIAAPYHGGTAAPDEDSVLTEFDETNLFSLRRHSGWDGVEEGSRMNIGLRYAMTGDNGADFSATVGRVYRARAIDSFGASAGLNGRESAFVGAWSLTVPEIGRITHRMRVSDGFDVTRNEIYAEFDWRDVNFLGSYVYLTADEAAATDTHEAALEARYSFTPNWSAGADLRRDVEADSWTRTGGLLRYSNECVDLELYAGRRFTRTEDVPASTYAGVRVRLWALGGGANDDRPPPTGACAPRS
jgi:LPS-assembly protein